MSRESQEGGDEEPGKICVCNYAKLFNLSEISAFPGGLVVRIWRSHRHGRGSIPRLGIHFSFLCYLFFFFFLTESTPKDPHAV